MSDDVNGSAEDRSAGPKKRGVWGRLVEWFRSPGAIKVEPSDELVLERELRRGMRGDAG